MAMNPIQFQCGLSLGEFQQHYGDEAACDARWANFVLDNVTRALDGTYHALRFAKYGEWYPGETA